MEKTMFAKGDEYRKQNSLTDELCLKLEEISLSDDKDLTQSETDKRIEAQGKDEGQGNYLVGMKNTTKK